MLVTGFAYWEWSSLIGTDLDDRESVRAANPAFGTRINEDFVFGVERATMDDEEFGRERLGIFPDPDEDTEVPGWLVIGEDAWKACGTDETAKQSEKPGWLVGAVTLAVEVRPDRSSATVVAAGECREGGIGVEPVASGVGVGWIVAEVQALCERGDVATVVVDEGGPAGVLIDPLIAAGVDVTRVAFADVKQATAEFFDAVTAAEVVHRDRPELSEAVGWAQKRPAGDTWLIDRKGPHDASPLVAAVLARHGHLSQDRGGYALAFYV